MRGTARTNLASIRTNQARDGALIAAPAQCPLFSRVPMKSAAPGRVAIGGPSNRRRGRWPVARAAHARNSRFYCGGYDWRLYGLEASNLHLMSIGRARDKDCGLVFS
jgi:hypothetical protein